MSDENIIKLARERKKKGRINMDDVAAAKNAIKKMSPGEKKARFSESDDYQDMVAKKLKIGMGELFGTAPRILQKTLRKMGPPPNRLRTNTKAVLDSQGKPVKNLRQAAKQGGQFEEVDVMDLTTEMVIDE
jgi:hypothetical protein